jgi:hypothetical protein
MNKLPFTVYELGNDMVRDVKASEFGSRLDGVESCFTVIAGDYVGANVEVGLALRTQRTFCM